MKRSNKTEAREVAPEIKRHVAELGERAATARAAQAALERMVERGPVTLALDQDAGVPSLARGAMYVDQLSTWTYRAAGEYWRPTTSKVARRVPSSILYRLCRANRAAAAAYAGLVESQASVSGPLDYLEPSSGGSISDGGAVSRTMISDRVAEARRAIGYGFALRVEPGAGHGRSSITVLGLVDLICVEGRSVTAVLKYHGWGKSARAQDVLRERLIGALDRLDFLCNE